MSSYHSWRAVFNAAYELSERTGVKHRVYYDRSIFSNGWKLLRQETCTEAYNRIYEDVTSRWRNGEFND